MKRLLVTVLAGFALAGCTDAASTPEAEAPAAVPAEAVEAEPVAALAPLPEIFDCLRQNGGVLVASHRGGPAPGYPENALETIQHRFSKGIRVFELDVATSRDGVMFLHHDDRFGRTADGDGYVSDTDWADIAKIRLKDTDGDLNIDLLDNGVWTGSIAFTDQATVPFRGCFKGCKERIGAECQDDLTICEIPAAP
jgi:glycerophosphoryl diester phosphodiesterase